MAVNKKVLMSLFIAGIMIISVMGFALTYSMGGGETVKYNDYKFTRMQQGYKTKIGNQRAIFAFLPTSVEQMTFDETAKSIWKPTIMLWMTYDPNDQNSEKIADAMFYMEERLTKIKEVYVQRGLINNTGYELLQITCDNSTSNVPVLVIQKGNLTEIKEENSCIIATAQTPNDVYRLADLLLYTSFEVIE